jgi:hypothetical protein
VCWTLTGFASGYLSRAYGRDIYCIEERCRGKGDAVCRLVGRPIEEWGETIKPHLVYYQKGCLDSALAQVTAEGLAVPTAVAATDVKPLAEVERDYIGAVLRAVGGNRSQAAAKLGIGPARQELTGSTRSAPAPGG